MRFSVQPKPPLVEVPPTDVQGLADTKNHGISIVGGMLPVSLNVRIASW